MVIRTILKIQKVNIVSNVKPSMKELSIYFITIIELTIGHRVMRVFLSRYGIYLSKTTIHKYMNKTLNLVAIIM